MNFPITGSALYDCVGAVVILAIGGFLWGKDNKFGGIVFLIGIVWAFMAFLFFARRM